MNSTEDNQDNFSRYTLSLMACQIFRILYNSYILHEIIVVKNFNDGTSQEDKPKIIGIHQFIKLGFDINVSSLFTRPSLNVS